MIKPMATLLARRASTPLATAPRLRPRRPDKVKTLARAGESSAAKPWSDTGRLFVIFLDPEKKLRVTRPTARQRVLPPGRRSH
jgi:hypothetical protein